MKTFAQSTSRGPTSRIRSRQGFTLLELIVVITIIGLLGTLVVVNTTGITRKARVTKIENDLRAILDAAEMMYTSSGQYPETLDEMVNPKDDEGMAVVGGLRELPLDPWGNEYTYEMGNDGPQVSCLGKDGVEGGEGDDADFIKPEQEY